MMQLVMYTMRASILKWSPLKTSFLEVRQALSLGIRWSSGAGSLGVWLVRHAATGHPLHPGQWWLRHRDGGRAPSVVKCCQAFLSLVGSCTPVSPPQRLQPLPSFYGPETQAEPSVTEVWPMSDLG